MKRITRKWIALLVPFFLLTIVFTMSPGKVSAATSGDYTFKVVNGQASITGYVGSYSTITIPSTIGGYTVTSIGDSAFLGSKVNYVTIPNGVTTIGASAFQNCTLANVNIPNSVTTIGASAFQNSFLASFNISKNVINIGDNAFGGITQISVDADNPSYSVSDGVLFNKTQTKLIQCSSEKSGTYSIPSSVTSIGAGAFYNCRQMYNVIIPNTVTSIGDNAFENCYSLTNISIPNSVTSIGSLAFKNSGLTSVTIPSSVTNISVGPFAWCNKLTTINIDENNQYFSSIGNVLFNKDQTKLIQVPARIPNYVIPNSVTSIGDYAFAGNSPLSVTIPSSVISIGNSAFSDCSSLGEITIPNSVAFIGASAFSGCNNLKSITLPNSLASIGDSSFSGCSSLTNITLPSNLTSIGNYVFMSCVNLNDVSLPESLTSIGDGAFENCSYNLKNITIPNGVIYLGASAFEGCNNLINITIPDSVTSIGNSAFYNCSNLINIILPNGITSISDYSFYHCTNLTSVTIPSSVTSIGHATFIGCSSLTNIMIPNSVTSIGDCAFSGCSSLKSIKIPNGIRDILDNTFAGCGLQSITIPSSVISVGDDAFISCRNLVCVYVLNGSTTIGNAAFFTGNTALKINGISGSPTEKYTVGDYWSSFVPLISSLVTFNSIVGSSVTSETIALNSIVPAPVSPTRIGYTFAGWYKEAEYVNAWNFDTDVVTEDTTLYAKWIPLNITNISISQQPNKTIYIQGQNLDLTWAQFLVTYNDGSTETINVTPNIVSGYESNKVGTQNITISYNGQTTTFNVTVVAKVVTGISMNQQPIKTSYVQSQIMDATGAKILATYNDGFTQTVDVTPAMISGYNTNQAGNQTITVTYNGQTTTFNIAVVAKVVTSVSLSQQPSKVSYIQGQSLDGTDAKIQAIYNDGSTQTVDVTPTMIGGFNPNLVGTQTITVSYNDKSTTFKVFVVAKVVTGISMNQQPTKTSYVQGQGLDLTGAQITLTYNDGSTQADNVIPGMVSGYNSNQVGTQTITVSYNGQTTTFNVSVVAKTVTNISKSQQPVSFDSQGGNSVAAKTTNYNTLITAPTAPTRTGYTFDGWYKESACTNMWNFGSDQVTSDTTLYAKWIAAPISVSYQGHVQNIGWQDYVKDGDLAGTEGQSLRVEGFRIKLENAPEGLHIKYKAHVQNIGWQDWVYDGEMAGTQGQSLRVEALQIMLEGIDAEKFSIQYQAHVQNEGWQRWVKDGEISGTFGKSQRIEAVRIKITEKLPSVSYQGHVQNIGWQDYVKDGDLAGTEGQSLRVEGFRIKLENAPEGLHIKYKTHVQNIGWQDWVYDGEMAGTQGQSLRVEALQIILEGTDAEKYSVQYQAHVQNIGWQPWVNDGEIAGTFGQSLRIEAVRIRIVEK